jgi:hypothetical protein
MATRTRANLLFEKLTLFPKLILRPAKSPRRARLAMASPRAKTPTHSALSPAGRRVAIGKSALNIVYSFPV